MRLFIATDSDSCLSISIALHCAFAIICTFVDCCTSICTYVDSCSSTSTMFSFHVSFCTIYASTNCCSITSFSSNSSMNTESIDVAFGPICSFAHQRFFLLCKNLTIDVIVIFISWIIVYKNYIFSLYTFLFTHSKDDECNNDLIAKAEYATHFHTLLFLTLLSLMLFSTISLPPASSCYYYD